MSETKNKRMAIGEDTTARAAKRRKTLPAGDDTTVANKTPRQDAAGGRPPRSSGYQNSKPLPCPSKNRKGVSRNVCREIRARLLSYQTDNVQTPQSFTLDSGHYIQSLTKYSLSNTELFGLEIEESILFNGLPVLPDDHDHFGKHFELAAKECLKSISNFELLSASINRLKKRLQIELKRKIDVGQDKVRTFTWEDFILNARRDAAEDERKKKLVQSEFDKTNQNVSNLNENLLTTNQNVSKLGDDVSKLAQTSEQRCSRIGGMLSVAENMSKSEQKFDVLVQSTAAPNRIIEECDARQTPEAHDHQMQALRQKDNATDARLARLEAAVVGNTTKSQPYHSPFHTSPMGRGYAPPMGRGYAPPMGRGYAPPMGRGYASPMGRGYASPMGRSYALPMGGRVLYPRAELQFARSDPRIHNYQNFPTPHFGHHHSYGTVQWQRSDSKLPAASPQPNFARR